MGRIGQVLEFIRATAKSAKIPRVKIDLGGGDNRMADIFQSPVDSQPLESDEVVVVPGPRSGSYIAVGFNDPKNEGIAEKGEYRIYSRDASGAIIAGIHLKMDGGIDFFNNFGGIELLPNGSVDINGVVIDASGNIEGVGDLEASGDIDTTGTVIGLTDVEAGVLGVSGATHVHGGVTSGGASTGIPV